MQLDRLTMHNLNCLIRPVVLMMLVAIGLGGGCAVEVGDEHGEELELDQSTDPALEQETEPTDDETLIIAAVSSTREARVSNGHGTAYVWVQRKMTSSGIERRAGLVDECSGGTKWRIKNVNGTILTSGTRSNCVGGGIGGTYLDLPPVYDRYITVQIWRTSTSSWVTAVRY